MSSYTLGDRVPCRGLPLFSIVVNHSPRKARAYKARLQKERITYPHGNQEIFAPGPIGKSLKPVSISPLQSRGKYHPAFKQIISEERRLSNYAFLIIT